MVEVNKAVVAKINKNGKNFEILIDPDLVEQYKKGSVEISEILAMEDIFEDSKKGLRAGKNELERAFNTSDVLEVAKEILKHGKVHTTSEQRDKERDQKWNKIVSLIAVNAVDPKTNNPIPAATIDDALHQVVFRIDNRRVEDLLPEAIKSIKPVLAFSFVEKTIKLIELAPNVAGGCLNICKQLGTIVNQTWNNDSSLTITIKIPAGLEEEFIEKINGLTHGQAQIEYIGDEK